MLLGHLSGVHVRNGIIYKYKLFDLPLFLPARADLAAPYPLHPCRKVCAALRLLCLDGVSDGTVDVRALSGGVAAAK